MQNNIYVDTNIIIDICDKNRPCYVSSLEMISMFLNDSSMELYMNSDTLLNLFYILRQHSKIPYKETLEKMRYISEIFTLVNYSMQEVEKTLVLCEDDNELFNDYEDTMQYICAKKVDAQYIVTNDKKFVSCDITLKRTLKKVDK